MMGNESEHWAYQPCVHVHVQFDPDPSLTGTGMRRDGSSTLHKFADHCANDWIPSLRSYDPVLAQSHLVPESSRPTLQLHQFSKGSD